MYDWRTILRPIWGFVALQPVILIWFYIFSDDWLSDYTALGWPLQIVSTFWLIRVMRCMNAGGTTVCFRQNEPRLQGNL